MIPSIQCPYVGRLSSTSLRVLGAGLAVLLFASDLQAAAQTDVVGWGAQVVDSTWSEEALVEVAAGLDHTLALRADGSLVAWGDDTKGQCKPPALPPGVSYVGVAAGGHDRYYYGRQGFSLALRSDGEVLAWGSNPLGECNVPTLPAGLSYVQVAAGGAHGVAIRSDGSVVAWGDDGPLSFGQTGAPWQPPGFTYVTIAAGGAHSLAIRSDGMVVAWGNNSSGQCDVPSPPPGLDYIQVAAGGLISDGEGILGTYYRSALGHSLGLLSDGSVVAWGRFNEGQCIVPALPPGLTYVEVAAGSQHSMALRSDGSVAAWGRNDEGQCDVPDLPPGLAYVAVSAGFRHSVARRSDGTVVAWGDEAGGQCNVPIPPADLCYTQIRSGGSTYTTYVASFPWDSLAMGHTVALRSDGQVVVWGDNSFDQQGVPVLPPGVAYVEVAAGAAHSLALRSDGWVVGWGYDNRGQLSAPALPPGVTYVEVAAGGGHSLARRSDGEVFAWGDNRSGECNVPPLPPGVSYTQIDAGGSEAFTYPIYSFLASYYIPPTWGHSIARRSDGSVVAWGDNSFGQCDIPALPPGLTYVEVAASAVHGLARRSDGSVVAWGDNSRGECNVPALPPGLSYTEIAAGGCVATDRHFPAAPHGYSVARRSDGSIVAWGDTGYGVIDVPAPPPGRVYTGVSAGSWHAVALTREEPGAVSYCAATRNSTGNSASIHALGSASLAENDLELEAVGLPDGLCVFFHGTSQQQTPFGNGFLCVGGSLVRTLPPAIATSGLARTFIDLPSASITTPGARNFQCWFRDPGAVGGGFNTSDALSITFVP